MSNEPHILVIDDEPQIVRALRVILSEKGYRVTTANRGGEGLTLAATAMPDIIILDIGLPDMSGFDVCSQLREWTQTPIIVLSVRDNEQDKVAILDRGADDYLIKPFGIDELLARIRVALRHRSHANGATNPVVKMGAVTIDLANHTVTRDDEEIKLTATEFSLLAYLVSNPGRVLTHHSILGHVWGWEESDNVEYLRVYMMQLRKKLEDNPRHPQYLMTEAGVGYRFINKD